METLEAIEVMMRVTKLVIVETIISIKDAVEAFSANLRPNLVSCHDSCFLLCLESLVY